MPRTLLPAAGTLLVSTLLALGAASPAGAAHWGARDPRADVSYTTYDPDPQPCGTWTDLDGSTDTHHDITRVAVNHTRRAVRLTLRVRDLLPHRELLGRLNIATDGRAYEVWVSRGKSGKVRGALMRQPKYPPFPGETERFIGNARQPMALSREGEEDCGIGILTEGLGCRGLTATVSNQDDLVRVEMPRTCLQDPKWVRVAADLQGGTGNDFYSDRWAPAGVDEQGWIGPYGPRVRRG